MTGEQAKQYEVCKTRRHEQARSGEFIDQGYVTQGMHAAQNCITPWKTCRWCGTQYQEVPEIRQVERAQ